MGAWCVAAPHTDTWRNGIHAQPQRVPRLQGGEVKPQVADTWCWGQIRESVDLHAGSEHGPPFIGSGVLTQITWV